MTALVGGVGWGGGKEVIKAEWLIRFDFFDCSADILLRRTQKLEIVVTYRQRLQRLLRHQRGRKCRIRWQQID